MTKYKNRGRIVTIQPRNTERKSYQIGPKPIQLVVVIAVSAAVMAATITFRTSSRIFCLLFMVCIELRIKS